MKDIEFDVTLKTGELFSFTMRHTYYSISGIFSLLISLASLVACVATLGKFAMSTTIVLLFIAALFTVIQPLMLYGKCKAQIKRSENINAALHYILTEEEVRICQGEQEASVKWYEIRKAVYAKKGLYLYVSPVRAFIFPKEQCGEKYAEICSFVEDRMEKYKDFVPQEDMSEEEKISHE